MITRNICIHMMSSKSLITAVFWVARGIMLWKWWRTQTSFAWKQSTSIHLCGCFFSVCMLLTTNLVWWSRTKINTYYRKNANYFLVRYWPSLRANLVPFLCYGRNKLPRKIHFCKKDFWETLALFLGLLIEPACLCHWLKTGSKEF